MNRIYIAGPMTGLPEHNYPAFHAAAQQLRQQGHHVENPAESTLPPCGGTWLGWMRLAIAQLASCHEICLLPGWENSRGARVEHELARGLGLRIRHLPPLPAVRPPLPKPAYVHYERGMIIDTECHCYTAQQMDEHYALGFESGAAASRAALASAAKPAVVPTSEAENTLVEYAMQIAHERELHVLGHKHDSEGALRRFTSAVTRELARAVKEGGIAC